MINETKGVGAIKTVVGKLKQTVNRAFLTQKPDTVELSTKTKAKEGFLKRIIALIQNKKEAKLQQELEQKLQKERQALLETDLGKYLKKQEVDRPNGSSEAYTEKQICEIVKVHQENPDKAKKLIKAYHKDTSYTLQDAIKIFNEDLELYNALFKGEKINIDASKMETLLNLKNIKLETISPKFGREYLEALDIENVKILDDIATKEPEAAEKVLLKLGKKTNLLNTSQEPEMLAEFVDSYKNSQDLCDEIIANITYIRPYENDKHSRQEALKNILKLINVAKTNPVSKRFISEYKILEPAKLEKLIEMQEKGIDVEKYCKELKHTIPDVHSIEDYINFRERYKDMLDNFAKSRKLSESAINNSSADEQKASFMREMYGYKSIIERMVKDGVTCNSIEDFEFLRKIYEQFPNQTINDEFVNMLRAIPKT